MEKTMIGHSACDVLICGAGAAGLTLAIDLARRGVSFRLIEKNDGPFAGSRGKGIQPRSQEIFEDLGILDRLVAAGGLYPPQREYRADGSYAESNFLELGDPTPAEPYQIPLMVPQVHLAAAAHVAAFGGVEQFGGETEHAGKPDLAMVAWSAVARNSQELSSRSTEITIPSGQSAWTLSSAFAIAISSASVLVGLLMTAVPDHASNRCRLAPRQAVVEGMIPKG
jgi:FAD binding domain